MKIATWNVNSIKVRFPQILQWLKTTPVDVLCLQELKITEDKFPFAELADAGYDAACAGQKAYNGVAIISRYPLSGITKNNPLFQDEQQRIIAATTAGIRIISAYIPNGQTVGSEKYDYKLQWLKAFHDWVGAELHTHPATAILGDYNIAPEDRDVYDPVAWKGNVLVSEPERHAFRKLLMLGFKDAFRLFEQPEKSYSWWDYRQMAFRRNLGLRLDHILLSEKLAEKCVSCVIDREPRKWQQPSDHTPVIAEIRL